MQVFLCLSFEWWGWVYALHSQDTVYPVRTLRIAPAFLGYRTSCT